MPYYNEGTEERLIRALDSRFVELGCSQYPFLQAEKPTGATVRLLEQLVLPAGSGKTTALVTALREQVHGKLLALRDQTIRRYQEQFAIQSGAGLARIGQWPGAAWESARQLYEDLKDNYLFEELIASDSTSGWNDAIGGRLAAVCAESVPGAQAEYAGLLSFVRESCDCFGAHGGQLSQTHQAAVTGATEGWQYVLALHEPAQNPAAAMDAQMAALEKAGFLLDHYPKEQRNALAGMVAARLIMLGKAAYPCLTEEKPTAQTVKALQQLPLPQAAEAQTSLVELLRDKIYEHLRQLRETVTRDYENQYAQQHCTGLAQIGQWCAGRYEGIAALFETLHQHYLFEELMAAAGDDCWNTAIGNRLVALCRGAEPRKLQDYKVLLAWADQSRGALEQQGGNLSAQQIADVDGVKAGWNHVLGLSERKCDSLAALLKLFADIRATAMDASLAASLMEAGMEPLAEKGISREEIFGNLPKLLKAAAAAPAGQLLRRLVCSCGELRQIAPDAAPEQIAQHLGNCVQLEAAGLMEGGILFPAWKAEAPAEKLYKLLQLLMNYRAGNPEPKFGNRHVRDWAAEKLQGNTDLMYRMAIRFPAYREKLIPVLARKSGAVSRDQLRELYVSGCRKSLLCQGALANTSASWQRHIEELFPEWPQLGQPCQMVLSAERKTCRTNLIIQMLLLVLAGLVPGAAMLLTGVFSMAVSAIWLAVLIVILAVCEIVSFVAHNRLQCRFARWLGLGTLPGIILTIVVLIIHFV